MATSTGMPGIGQTALALVLAPHHARTEYPDDQLLISESLRPGLTTVALPHEEMGRWAVRTLLDRIDAPSQSAPATHALLPCPVVSRGSVAGPATGPP